MPPKPSSRLVFSTERPTCPAATCSRCGWPRDSCRCAAQLDQPVPDKIVVVLRMEKAGRGGKTVTVVDGLPRNTELVKRLTGELKRACGTGGTARETSVEIQGDRRDTLRPHRR